MTDYPINHHILTEDFREQATGKKAYNQGDGEWLHESLIKMCDAYDEIVDKPQEVFMVWDTARMMKGEHAQLLAVFGSVDDAIDYAKKEFPDPEDDWQYANIEHWIIGNDHPEHSYTLAENQDSE